MMARITWGMLTLAVVGFIATALLDPPRVAFALQTTPARVVLESVGSLKPYFPKTYAVAMQGVQPKATGRARRGGGAAPVQIAKSETRTIPVVLEGIGNVQAISTVAIKSRVDGQLFEALVTDGQVVKTGDLLFRLDAGPFEAQLKQAEANLVRDKANLAKAEGDVQRFQELARKGISPQTRLEEASTTMNTLRASISASMAAIDLAKLNLSYATIKSPIDGRVGSVLVTPGNMVKANDTQALVVITTTNPVNVAFGLAEQHLDELRRRFAEGKLKVEVVTEGWQGPPALGELFFINNTVDTSTGTIQVMARVSNAGERLLPGQFIRAKARIRELENAITVPIRAVQINQKGHYVWTMAEDKTVKPISVVLGPEVGGHVVIEKGIGSGVTVITDGQLRLFPGAEVQPQGADGKGNGKGKAQS